MSDLLTMAADLYGLEFGKTSYDDIIMITAFLLAVMAIYLIIQLFRGFISR
nr:unnamed protein product [uncultured bacterium]